MAIAQYNKVQTPKSATTIRQNTNTNELTKLYGTNNTGVNKLTSVYGTNRSNELDNTNKVKTATVLNSENSVASNNAIAPEASVSNTTKTNNNVLKDYLNTPTYTAPITVDQETAYEKLLQQLSGGQNYDASKKWNQQDFLKEEDWNWQDIIKAENAYTTSAYENKLKDKTNAALEQAAIDKENALRDAYINNEFAKKNLQSNLQSRGLGTSGIASSFDNELFNMYLNNTNNANSNYKSNIKDIKDAYDDSSFEIDSALSDSNENSIKNYQDEKGYLFDGELQSLQDIYGENREQYLSEYEKLLSKYKDKLGAIKYYDALEKLNIEKQDYQTAKEKIAPLTITFTMGTAGEKYDRQVNLKDENGTKYYVAANKTTEKGALAEAADKDDKVVFKYANKLYFKLRGKVYCIDSALSNLSYMKKDYDDLYKNYGQQN